MKLIKIHHNRNEKGFTITEIMIALPIVSLILITLLGSLFLQYTETLAESSTSALRTDGQRLLINLQDELLFTIAWGEDLEANLSDPYEPSGGWTYSSDPETLIINEVALDSTRQDEDRHIVRRRFNDCESSPVTSNPVALNNIIYFVEPDPVSGFGRLIKRTLTPTFNTCSIDSDTDLPCTPTTTTCRSLSRETSCPAEFVGVGNCKVADTILSENVTDMDITYYAEGNIETPLPSNADKIEVVLKMGDKVYGQIIETEVKHTIRKIN